MNPPFHVTAVKVARDQLADLHLKFRMRGQMSRVAYADCRIQFALEQNP